MNARVLIVDDDFDTREMLEAALRDAGYQTSTHGSAEDALRALDSEDFDVILADVMMPRVGGTDLCRHISENHPDVPVVMITAHGSADVAVDAIRAGAYDFLTKPFNLQDLRDAVVRAVAERRQRRQMQRLDGAEEARTFPEIVGPSPAMRAVLDQLPRVANSETTVLIMGESGTGKELIARAIHDHGRRHAGPFMAINCAAVPAQILESELFGRMRGAFTGATTAFPGLFREAEAGTLFLDEIGAMPMELQPKLLRALQERAVRPVGGETELPFDARIIAATNSDLEQSVHEGRFREDLMFRLGVIRITLPPLRSRSDDVVDLARHLIKTYGASSGKQGWDLTSSALSRLREYHWPGNVRELENCIQSAVTFAREGRIDLEDLPTTVRSQRGAPPELESRSLESIELQHILKVLDAVGGNKAAAARVLRIDRTTLYRKLAKVSSAAPRARPTRSV